MILSTHLPLGPVMADVEGFVLSGAERQRLLHDTGPDGIARYDIGGDTNRQKAGDQNDAEHPDQFVFVL